MSKRKKTKRINPIVAYGIKARKRHEQRKKEEAKRLARLKKMEIRAKKWKDRIVAKEVAKIRKKTKIEYN